MVIGQRQRPRQTLWDSIKTYINEVYRRADNNNQIFTRQGLISELESKGHRIKTNSYSTMDQYRNLLSKAGYIRTINRRGWYYAFKEIPCDLYICDARWEAYGGTESKQPKLMIMGYDNKRRIREKDFIEEREFKI